MSRRNTELLLLIASAFPVILLYAMYVLTAGATISFETLAVPIGLFAAFAAALERSVYARGGADEETVALGQSAYEQLLTRLRRGERLRFLARRILRGLGDFEQIP